MSVLIRLFLWTVLVAGALANAALSLRGGGTFPALACGCAAVVAAAALVALRRRR
ncbi:hypothetical protein ACL02R_18260 [Streptomyces sp. MS19]|uniref:hypothetical protein n=1 Tax=Streptomyces sp. MS19 TaxID=3385972 RepID=UPI00399F87B3